MNATMNRNKQIAETILSQLGGARFVAMTGAHNLGFDGPSLSFRFKGNRKVNYCKIALEANDTYTVEFWKIGRGVNFSKISEMGTVYADQLQAIFTAKTGLDCHL